MSFVKKHIVLLSGVLGLLIILSLSGWWAWSQIAPHPLGSGMVYLGKEDYGGIILADANPTSIFYYGTDIAPSDDVKYFKGATLEHPIENTGQYADVWLILKGKSVAITYYNSRPANIEQTNKKYLVGIRSDYYKILQDSV